MAPVMRLSHTRGWTHPLGAHKPTQTRALAGRDRMPRSSVGRDVWEGDTGLTIELSLAHANNDDGHREFGSLGEDRGGEKS